jgi:hypothetical protein
VDPRACPDDLEKSKFLTLPGLELRPLCRPTRSQSLYRLRYPSSLVIYTYVYHLKLRFSLLCTILLPSVTYAGRIMGFHILIIIFSDKRRNYKIPTQMEAKISELISSLRSQFWKKFLIFVLGKDTSVCSMLEIGD